MDDPSTWDTGVGPELAIMGVDALSFEFAGDHFCFIVSTERSDKKGIYAGELGQKGEDLTGG